MEGWCLEVKVTQSCSTLCSPMSMGFSKPEYWSRVALRDLPNPGIKPRSPKLQADSLLAEPQGKPKNTGVGSLSLLQDIFLTQESNQGLLHCRKILYQMSHQGSPNDTSSSHTRSRTQATWVALEEDLKVLGFAYWLNCYYLVTFDCFPFLLHVLTSLIKLTCWQKFFPQTKGQQRTWEARTMGSCSISKPQVNVYIVVKTLWTTSCWSG